jgi:dihydrofolate reductase
MGKEWEKKQMKVLVNKQQVKIAEIKAELEKEARIIAESQLYSKKNPKNLVTLIAAASENNVIGKDNKLIWHLSDDLKHFKELTKGHFVIMGRKTFESMPKALPNRTNVVITRKLDYKAENAIVVNSLDQALKQAENDNQPFIIGGGEIYKLAIEDADRIELTRVHTSIEGDAFFPEINYNLWEKVSSEKRFKDDKNEYDYTFYRYDKKN